MMEKEKPEQIRQARTWLTQLIKHAESRLVESEVSRVKQDSLLYRIERCEFLLSVLPEEE